MVLWIVIGVLVVGLLVLAARRQRHGPGDITPTSHIGEGPDRGGMGSGGMG